MDIQQRNYYRNLRRIELYNESLQNQPKRSYGKPRKRTIMPQPLEPEQRSQSLSRKEKSTESSKTTSQNSHHSPERQGDNHRSPERQQNNSNSHLSPDRKTQNSRSPHYSPERQQHNSSNSHHSPEQRQQQQHSDYDYKPQKNNETPSNMTSKNRSAEQSKVRSRIPRVNQSAVTQNGRQGNHDNNYDGRQRQSNNNGGSTYDESDYSNDYSPSPKLKDVLKREKIETELRNNRITETKIRKIAAKISQSYNTDEENYTIRESGLERHLRRIVSNSLDPMLYRSKGHTNLSAYSGDIEELVKKVTAMIKQLQGDLEACYSSILTSTTQIEEGTNRIRSIPQIIQQEVQELQTDYDVLYDKFKALSKDLTQSESKERESSDKVVSVSQQNSNLDKEIKRIKAEWTTMAEDYTKVKANEKELKESLRETEEEREKMEKKYLRVKEVNNVLTDECNKLTDENIRLNQENDHLDKEVKRLAEPDKKMMQKIQRLEQELVDLKTANRRLENEKGLIKGNLIKLESNYDLVQRDKKALTKERNKFWKENQELRTQNRKLTLSH